VVDRIKLAPDGWVTEALTADITTPPRQAPTNRVDWQEAAPISGALR